MSEGLFNNRKCFLNLIKKSFLILLIAFTFLPQNPVGAQEEFTTGYENEVGYFSNIDNTLSTIKNIYLDAYGQLLSALLNATNSVFSLVTNALGVEGLNSVDSSNVASVNSLVAQANVIRVPSQANTNTGTSTGARSGQGTASTNTGAPTTRVLRNTGIRNSSNNNVTQEYIESRFLDIIGMIPSIVRGYSSSVSSQGSTNQNFLPPTGIFYPQFASYGYTNPSRDSASISSVNTIVSERVSNDISALNNSLLPRIEELENSSSTGGSSQWDDIDGVGISYMDGNVGIGTTTPDATLVISDTNTARPLKLLGIYGTNVEFVVSDEPPSVYANVDAGVGSLGFLNSDSYLGGLYTKYSSVGRWGKVLHRRDDDSILFNFDNSDGKQMLFDQIGLRMRKNVYGIDGIDLNVSDEGDGNLNLSSTEDGLSTFTMSDDLYDENVNISGDGSAYFAGNVGIGTTDPQANIEIKNELNASLWLSYGTDRSGRISFYNGDGDENAYFLSDDDLNNFQINTDGRPLLLQPTGGNVGIGTNNPNHALSFSTAGATIGIADQLAYDAPGGALTITGGVGTAGGNAGGDLILKGGNSFTGESHAAGDVKIYGGVNNFDSPLYGGAIRMYTAGAERFTVLNDGNVGIGTNNPLAKLDIAGINEYNYVRLLTPYGDFTNGLSIALNDNGEGDGFGLIDMNMNPEEGFNITKNNGQGEFSQFGLGSEISFTTQDSNTGLSASAYLSTGGFSVTGTTSVTTLNITSGITYVGSDKYMTMQGGTVSDADNLIGNNFFVGIGAGEGVIPFDDSILCLDLCDFGGTENVMIGKNAGSGATNVIRSNFFGTGAGQGAISAGNSNFFGNNAGAIATNASYSNFFGSGAGQNATNAGSSNFFGVSAGSGATNAGNSNFFGGSAGQNATNAISSNFFGQNAGLSASGANNSNFLGASAGNSATNASNSNFFGVSAGSGATNANSSTFFGLNAGLSASGASNSNFFGLNAGLSASVASNSNFFGNNAGSGAISASGSNFFGINAGAGAHTAGSSNFIGGGAGQNATNASNSNFFGGSAGQNATNAISSNFFGQNAGLSASGANNSNFFGNNAGAIATNASYSNFFGVSAGQNATNAANSIFMGINAGLNDTVNNTSANRSSILIGNYTSTGGFSNSIAIGQGVRNSAVDQAVIGRVLFLSGISSSTSATSTPMANGRLGIGTSTPTQALSVVGTVFASNLLGGATTLSTDANGNIIRSPSDQSLKENITTIENALDKISQLRGVSYEWLDKARFGSSTEIGVIAQEVEQVVPEVVSSGGEYKSVKIANLVGLIIEAVKELKERVDTMFAWFGGNGKRLDVQGLVCAGDTCVTEAQMEQILKNYLNATGQQYSVPNQIVDTQTNTPTEESGTPSAGSNDANEQPSESAPPVTAPVEPVSSAPETPVETSSEL